MNIRISVIGTGRWGLNHVRTARQILGENFNLVCDAYRSNEEKIKEIAQDINIITDPNEIANDKSIDAVIIATPAETHFEIAKQMLNSGKSVLVEKPITLTAEDADELQRISEKTGNKLMVGHILLYHPAVIKMKEIISTGEIGELEYIYSNRLNLGRVRQEENILWSFAPHDISVIQYFVEEEPIQVFSHGARYLQENIEDTTITYLKYANGVNAHIFVNWLHPFKEQRMVVIGSNGMLVFEDSLQNEKLKLFHKDYKFEKGNLIKGSKDYEVIEFEGKQPLQAEQEHFFDCVINNKEPLTNGKHALEVMKILVEATNKLKEM